MYASIPFSNIPYVFGTYVLVIVRGTGYSSILNIISTLVELTFQWEEARKSQNK